LKHRSLVIACLFDDSDPARLNPSLDLLRHSGSNVLIDFRNEKAFAQNFLARVLDEWLAEAPYMRSPTR